MERDIRLIIQSIIGEIEPTNEISLDERIENLEAYESVIYNLIYKVSKCVKYPDDTSTIANVILSNLSRFMLRYNKGSNIK